MVAVSQIHNKLLKINLSNPFLSIFTLTVYFLFQILQISVFSEVKIVVASDVIEI